MKDRIVITISREYGSGGRLIGEKLAARLNMTFYDKKLLDMAAEKSGLDREILETADEKASNRHLAYYLSVGSAAAPVNDTLFHVQSAGIRRLAVKEDCVIVGRLGDYVLRDDPNCLKVFITAPFDERVRNIMKRHLLTESEALYLVKKMDAIRRNYCTYYTDGGWDPVKSKDIVIDSGVFGFEGSVELLVKAAELFKAKELPE